MTYVGALAGMLECDGADVGLGGNIKGDAPADRCRRPAGTTAVLNHGFRSLLSAQHLTLAGLPGGLRRASRRRTCGPSARAAIGGGRNIVRVCVFGSRVFLNGLRDDHSTGDCHDAGHDSTATLAHALPPAVAGVLQLVLIYSASPGDHRGPSREYQRGPLFNYIGRKKSYGRISFAQGNCALT